MKRRVLAGKIRRFFLFIAMNQPPERYEPSHVILVWDEGLGDWTATVCRTPEETACTYARLREQGMAKQDLLVLRLLPKEGESIGG